MMPLVALLVACGGGGGPTASDFEQSFRVDCIGMVPLGNSERWGTPQVLRSDSGVVEGRRCEATVRRADIALWDAGPQPANTGIAVLSNGTRWTATEFVEYQVDQAVGDFYVRGSYSGPFVSDSGEEVWGQGWVDLCDPTLRLDCPYNIEGATPYPFETSNRMLTAWGEGTDCRAVIDRDNGALQVDLQSGVWNGTNITQLYRSTCPDREDADPDWYRNRLTFRAGGVTGPGFYGPYKVTNAAGTQLPSLVWEVPPILVGSSVRLGVQDASQLCDDTAGPYVLRTLDWSSYDNAQGVNSFCSYEVVDGTPGSIWIECSQVRHDRLAPTEIPCTHQSYTCSPACDSASGTCGHIFEWSGACDVVYRGGP